MDLTETKDIITEHLSTFDEDENLPSSSQIALIAGGVLLVIALFLAGRRRGAAQKRAARKLIRGWRSVEDVQDVSSLLRKHGPTLLRPVVLVLLAEIERLMEDKLTEARHSARYL